MHFSFNFCARERNEKEHQFLHHWFEFNKVCSNWSSDAENDKSILYENLKYQTQRKEIVSLSACGCVVGYMLLGAAVGPFGSDQLFITSSPSLEGSSSSSYRSQQRAH